MGAGLAGWVRLAAMVLPAALWALAAGPASAQLGELPDRGQPVALVADSVYYDTNTGIVVAEGSVEVYYGERTLTADRITYDSRAERLSAEGAIVLRDESGATVYADIAELDTDLRDGIVRGARGVMAGGTARLSAVEARRFDGRYNVLSRAVYSPCDVCEEDPTPLWRIRARRIVHDEEARIIHYEDATFDVFGVPIIWVPYFQHPDPTVERATGFLAPSFFSSTNYGYGLQTPFYVVIDDQSDFTFTPFVTTGELPVAILEYRRAFESGRLRVSGSFTHTDFTGSDGFEGHVDTEGRFELIEGIDWGWDITAASDDGYLRYFDFSNADRLTSEVFVESYSEDGYFDVAAVRFQSLRDFEPAGQIPVVLPVFEAFHEFREPLLGGDLGFTAAGASLARNNGRDTTRLSFGAEWERRMVTSFGVALRAFASARVDLFQTEDDPAFDDEIVARFAPQAGIEARYPFIYVQESGTTHILEPIAQAIIAPQGTNDADIPNEDSLLVEFDETSLFDTSHFPGYDVIEEGPRLNLGLRYEVVSDNFSLDAAVGRVIRFSPAPEFAAGSGLSGRRSDWVGAFNLSVGEFFSIRNRLRLEDDFSIARNELFANVSWGPLAVEAGYFFLEADPTIGAPSDRQEISLGAALDLTDEWTIGGFVQRDLELDEFVLTTATLSFHNECCEIDLFIKRRFTDSDDVPASTTVGVRVELLTLGSGPGDAR